MVDRRGLPSISRRTLLGGAVGLAATGALKTDGAAQSAESAWRTLPSEGPAGRWDHSLGADDEAKQLILFGGRDAAGVSFGDTWLYDLSEREWRAVETPGPEPRFGHAVALDQVNRRMILFGGETGDVFYNDTWVFDFEDETWAKIHDGSGTAPSPRYGLGAVLDTEGRLIVSHGFTFEGRFDDTWAFDLDAGAWTDISPLTDETRPLKRCLHEMTWHPGSETLLLYGGCSSGFGPCPQGDLWQFDPWARTWFELTPGESPAPRSNPALLYDGDGERMLLLGGLSEVGYVNDIWQGTLDDGAFSWQQIAPEGDAPSPRASHDAILTRGDVYLFGGTGDSGVTADLWKLSLT